MQLSACKPKVKKRKLTEDIYDDILLLNLLSRPAIISVPDEERKISVLLGQKELISRAIDVPLGALLQRKKFLKSKKGGRDYESKILTDIQTCVRLR